MIEIIRFQSCHLGTGSNGGVAVFVGSGPFDLDNIDSVFAQWLRTNAREETVVIFGSRAQIDRTFAEVGQSVCQSLERLVQRSVLRLAGFDPDGRILEITMEGKVTETSMAELFHDVVKSYFDQEVCAGDVVIPAPPGFWFEKLSKRYASHFIRAEALLKCTLTIELLALAILPDLQRWKNELPLSRRAEVTIYIDSMAIWPIAQKLVELGDRGSECAECTHYRIVSFQSYDGLESWHPMPGPAFVIVSASTSGSLAKIIQEKLAKSYLLCTLIALEPASNVSELTMVTDGLPSARIGPTCTVFNVPRKLTGRASFDGLRSNFEPGHTSLPAGHEAIQIVGERFANRYAKPRLVRLTAKVLTDVQRQQLSDFAKDRAVSEPGENRTAAVPIVVGRLKFDGKNYWPISFDLKQLQSQFVKGDPATTVLANWLRSYAPAGPVTIVFPSSHGPSAIDVTIETKNLAIQTYDVLRCLSSSNIQVLSSNDLHSQYVQDNDSLRQHGFIVVAPVLGSGFVFKQISALLRSIQRTGPRLFISYVTLPESEADLSHLAQDLQMASDDRSYHFLSMYKLPIGRLEHVMQWTHECEILESVLEDQVKCQGEIRQLIVTRVEKLRQGNGLAGNEVFLPSLNEKPLHLSAGFAMWTDGDRINGDHLAGHVLLTIAAALEATRSSKSKLAATSLRPGIFQQAVLDPLTFTRYNDSVIQAAILRAAYASELDYRASAAASEDMARLIIKWSEQAAHPIGYAIPEFILAMGLKKLRLCEVHEKNVLEALCLQKNWLGALASTVWERLGFGEMRRTEAVNRPGTELTRGGSLLPGADSQSCLNA